MPPPSTPPTRWQAVSAREQARLIVINARHGDAIRRPLLSSAAAQLPRIAPCPVIVIPDEVTATVDDAGSAGRATGRLERPGPGPDRERAAMAVERLRVGDDRNRLLAFHRAWSRTGSGAASSAPSWRRSPEHCSRASCSPSQSIPQANPPGAAEAIWAIPGSVLALLASYLYGARSDRARGSSGTERRRARSPLQCRRSPQGRLGGAGCRGREWSHSPIPRGTAAHHHGRMTVHPTNDARPGTLRPEATDALDMRPAPRS